MNIRKMHIEGGWWALTCWTLESSVGSTDSVKVKLLRDSLKLLWHGIVLEGDDDAPTGGLDVLDLLARSSLLNRDVS